MIDQFYDYQFGRLEYRGLKFETETLDMENYQGNAVINYTERKIPYTRIIEHKHFEGSDSPKTIVTKEYPAQWNPGDEAYYPVNNDENNEIYTKYEELASQEEKIIFGGRLGTYKYYDMWKIIDEALNCVEKEKELIE